MTSLRAPAQRPLPFGLTACLPDSGIASLPSSADGAPIGALALVVCTQEGRPC